MPASDGKLARPVQQVRSLSQAVRGQGVDPQGRQAKEEQGVTHGGKQPGLLGFDVVVRAGERQQEPGHLGSLEDEPCTSVMAKKTKNPKKKTKKKWEK